MPHDIRLTFTEPNEIVAALFLYGLILGGLAFATWRIWQVRTASGAVVPFLVSSKGRPYLTILLLGLLFLYVMLVKTHTGFWSLHLTDRDRLALDYWFPHPDHVVHSQDITALKLTVRQYYSKGENTGEDWIISLVTRKETEYKSIAILSEDIAKQTVAALEQWAGLPSTHYRRHGRWGFFSTPEQVAQ